MPEHEITCINKPNRMSAHEHIQYIGNQAGKWKLTLQSAISRILSKSDAFYTVDTTTGKRIYVHVYPATAGKHAHLQTYADGKWKDNLLALPECGPDCRVIS
jgi:hypothetical protein